MRLRSGILLGLLSVFVGGGSAGSHPFAPSLLELREMSGGLVAMTWKTPRQAAAAAELHPLLPRECEVYTESGSEADGTETARREMLRCGTKGLIGLRIGVEGIASSTADVLLRVALADGRTFRRVLTPESASFVIPEREQPREVAWGYLRLGIKHIATGFDHLAFVFGLLLLVSGRPLFWTISAFTLGHSITLSAAVLGLVRVPTAPLEAAIALSIVFVAVEVAREGAARPTLGRRFPWGMAAVFGLLHGFGFAGALTAAGLPPGEIPLALLSFNVGIEIGQIAFVLTVLSVGSLLASRIAWRPAAARLASAYVIGSLAAFWFLQRVAAAI